MMTWAPPGPKGNIPWNWDRRRSAVLDNPRTQNVPDWVVPFGYAAHHEPMDDPTKELELLIATQDRDLAPIASELVENGIQAMSIDQPAEDGSEDSLSDLLSDDDIIRPGDIVYERPSRRELWLMEQDRQRWYCGPVLKARLVPLPNGHVTLQTVPGLPITQEEAMGFLGHCARNLAHMPIPTAQQITGAQQECIARAQYYGRNWQLSLLTEQEIQDMKSTKHVYAALNEDEQDILRTEIIEGENLIRYEMDRETFGYHNEYSGPEELGAEYGPDEVPTPDEMMNPIETDDYFFGPEYF